MYFTHSQFKKFSLRQFFKKISEADLKTKLAKFFPNRYIVFTNLGRSAFQIAIKKLELENSEMLAPAYICDIFLPIFEHFHIKPIYLDIDLKTFNIQIPEIEKNITSKTKSILVCHTYGLPNDMDKILEIAKKFNLKIIEDCAHSFGAEYQNEYMGNFGDCAFFSLSKFLPTINGGLLISKNPIRAELKKYKFKISNLVKFVRVFPILANLSENFRQEDISFAPKNFSLPQRTSGWCLEVLNQYLDDFEQRINKRIELAKYFQEKLQQIGFEVQETKNNIFTYLSALAPENINRDELFNKLRKKSIFCSRIWHKPIYSNLPNTTEAAKRIINFPLQNWFEKEDIDKIISYI